MSLNLLYDEKRVHFELAFHWNWRKWRWQDSLSISMIKDGVQANIKYDRYIGGRSRAADSLPPPWSNDELNQIERMSRKNWKKLMKQVSKILTFNWLHNIWLNMREFHDVTKN